MHIQSIHKNLSVPKLKPATNGNTLKTKAHQTISINLAYASRIFNKLKI